MKIIRFSQKGLVGYWRFDEETGSTAKDSSPYGNHGTIYGATRVRGIIGKALSFDGVDDYVEVANSESLNPTNEITLMAWVNARSTQNTEYPKIVAKANAYVLHILDTFPSVIVLNIYSGGNLRQTKIENALSADEWVHIVATYDGRYGRIYKNGELVATKDFETIGIIDSTANDVGIGAYPGGSTPFNGTIDEVRIYNRALSPGEIKIIYAFTKYIKPHPIIMRRKL